MRRMSQCHVAPGSPACWNVQREVRVLRDGPARGFFESAENGTFCGINLNEGHGGGLGEVDRSRSPHSDPAPALLGHDTSIYLHCPAHLPEVERATFTKDDDEEEDVARTGGAVAVACVAASHNILNMVGSRVPYNLCRNLERQVCAAKGLLPGQDATGSSPERSRGQTPRNRRMPNHSLRPWRT